MRKHVEAFFINYQKLRDVEVRIIGRQGRARANEILRETPAKAARQKRRAA
jgi:hypothetical protein